MIKINDKAKTFIVCAIIIITTFILAILLTQKEPFYVTYTENNPYSQTMLANGRTINSDGEISDIVDEQSNFLDSTSSETFSGINTFNNGDISFKHLSSWSPKNNTENSEIDFLINGRNAMFSVVKEEVPEKFTIKDYVSSTKKTIEKKENNNIIKTEDTAYNNLKGTTIVYEIINTENNTKSIVNEFCLIHNNHIYVFTYYTDETKYENYLNEYEDLLNTLTFLN